MLPAWALLTVGLLIGLIGGVLAVAKTGAAAKIGLISTDRATAYATSILAEERGQIQAMLDEYYRNNRIQLAKEMEEFRKEQGRKPPEKMTMDDLLESDEAPPEKKPEAKEPEAKADTPAEPVPTDGKPKDAVE